MPAIAPFSGRLITAFTALLMTGACQTSSPVPRGIAPQPTAPSQADADLTKATRLAKVPDKWNGTLLLFSRGYSIKTGTPDLAPEGAQEALLNAGYALAASDYGSAGWALAEAVPAQVDTITWFTRHHGKPRRVIAIGNSMGGLVTTALAENYGKRIDGGIAFCPSIGGATGMMNMALDGAFAFRTLVAPNDGLELVNITDDRENSKRADAAVARAMTTAEGRARLTLAAVLGGLPKWTIAGTANPTPEIGPEDSAAVTRNFAAAFTRGILLPRQDQEGRAKGNFSWNTGVDYAAQLEKSGQHALVSRLYQEAGLDLSSDLARLAAQPRISAEPAAAEYMLRHYTPTAKPQVPLLGVQKIGDGLTSPSMLRGYGEAASPRLYSSAWINEAGHCNFSAPQVIAAIDVLKGRLDNGQWPRTMPAPFVKHTLAPFLRACFQKGECK